MIHTKKGEEKDEEKERRRKERGRGPVWDDDDALELKKES